MLLLFIASSGGEDQREIFCGNAYRHRCGECGRYHRYGVWKYYDDGEEGYGRMKDLLEIRWHGRGGQGAKTAALLLADVAFSTGMYVQGFPEYGPERMGAPITAYNRLSRKPIRVHSNIYSPDMVVVVDETLLDSIDVTNGLKEDVLSF